MALIDRVKERTKAELSDAEIGEMINEALEAIEERYGEPAQPVTERLGGGSVSIFTAQPIDQSADIIVAESVFDEETELLVSDFQIGGGGRRIERLDSGTNPRSTWGDSVVITYTPRSDQKRRDEVVIKLVMLGIEYEGVKSANTDGYSSSHLDYQTERERLIASLDRSLKMA